MDAESRALTDKLRDIINGAERIVFFGGAGVSTESGIPDFRSSSGLYSTESEVGYSPEQMLHERFFRTHTEEFYSYYRANMIYRDAEPNGAHKALAYLERQGKLTAVITQNIDGLHQAAGSENVIELHGTVHENYCTECGKSYDLDFIMDTDGVPLCECEGCRGVIKPKVTLYGEALDTASFERASLAVGAADVLIIGGTSLTVFPAAYLAADFGGEHLIIINKSPTPYDDEAELVIRAPRAEVLTEAVMP